MRIERYGRNENDEPVLLSIEEDAPEQRSVESDLQKEGDMTALDLQRAARAAIFDQENRLRALEGQPPRTQEEFRTYVKALL